MAVNLPREWTLTNDGERFLLYDSKEDPDEQMTIKKQRVIIFASKMV
jgi:hypothetical protein